MGAKMAKEALLKEPLSTDVDRLDEIFGEKLVTEHAKVDAHQIRPRLLLGSASAAMDPDQVHEYRITHVVNCLHTSCERFSKKKHQVLPEPQYPRLVAAYAEHKQTPVTYLEYLSLDLQVPWQPPDGPLMVRLSSGYPRPDYWGYLPHYNRVDREQAQRGPEECCPGTLHGGCVTLYLGAYGLHHVEGELDGSEGHARGSESASDRQPQLGLPCAASDMAASTGDRASGEGPSCPEKSGRGHLAAPKFVVASLSHKRFLEHRELGG